MQLDVVKFVSGLHDYIGKALFPLSARIKALEEREPVKPVDYDEVGSRIDTAIIRNIRDIRVMPDEVQRMAEEAVSTLLPAAIADLPPPKDGKDADPIEIAEVVAELSVCPEVRTVLDLLVAEAVAEYMAANPPARGRKGDPGPAGVGIAGALIDREGGLVVTLSNGEAKSLGPVVGKDGDPGKDGEDGFNLDDFAAEYDGEKTLRLVFARDDLRKEYEFTLPVVIDKGYWREGMGSKAGDGVTHAGSFWIAKRDNASKPCAENTEDWRLCVRKGRDGDPGPAGKAYVPPDPIKLETAQ